MTMKCRFIMRNTTNKCIHRYINLFYYTVNSVASYMFRPPIVTIFREVLSAGYIT